MIKFELYFEAIYVIAIIVLAILVFSFFIADVHYLIRWFFIIYWEKYVPNPIGILRSSAIYGICTLNDLDFVLKHMNNARFLREMDFARILFYVRSGAHNTIKSLGGDMVQSASSIRYRKTVPFLSTYKITTKLIYWDENSFYLEHEFITLKDGFVCAVVLSQQKLIKLKTKEVIQKLLKDEVPEAPSPPEDLVCWIDSIKHSSEKFRKQD